MKKSIFYSKMHMKVSHKAVCFFVLKIVRHGIFFFDIMKAQKQKRHRSVTRRHLLKLQRFNPFVAESIGVNPAILFQYLAETLLLERAYPDPKNVFSADSNSEQQVWIQISRMQLTEVFPYFNEQQITYAMRKLTQKKYVQQYQHRKGYSHSAWYSLTEKGWKYYKETRKNLEPTT